MSHLLVTNDFPPKVGGIQNYLWELWRRLPADEFSVLTTPYDGAADFDRHQRFAVHRFSRFFLSPTPDVRREVMRQRDAIGARLTIFDPAVPVGALGPKIGSPFGVVLHGAEVNVPARIPMLGRPLRHTLNHASLVISASKWATAEAERLVGRDLNAVYVPPGVDVQRFRPLTPGERHQIRRKHGLPIHAPVLLSVSRLVPRKGMDRLIDASVELRKQHADLQTVIVGSGRDERRLISRIASARAPVTLLGRVDDEDLPALIGSADVFAMLCRNRWAGLEQEGFGIVFVEAAAAGVPQVAGRSGGADEAVIDGETGIIVDNPQSVAEVTAAISALLTDGERRIRMGVAARRMAVSAFDYDILANELRTAILRTIDRRSG